MSPGTARGAVTREKTEGPRSGNRLFPWRGEHVGHKRLNETTDFYVMTGEPPHTITTCHGGDEGRRGPGPGQSPGGEPQAGRSPILRKNYFRYSRLDSAAKKAALARGPYYAYLDSQNLKSPA